ncbi:N-formylglutamate deformylase [Nitratireductor sp. StC3]|uniref:N-formylglutamate deformylase n=1 Tax=Nitratireductor sp. StC3 TaxID=2126741 RepID=UPI000D0CE7E8|nr:N-formylglutamate deformylase [Nitratireductor sp. StC3]PSM16581.1 N-formylglutamate deformylase [Nitratireductor sp. StC3]
MTPVDVRQGTSPVILGLPHTGTFLPAEIFERLNAQGRLLTDTDWHVDRLYDGLLPGVTTVRATFHRYVIDANRDPSGKSLYPGQNTTGLVPVTDFDDRPIWRDGAAPTDADVAERLDAFHRPYHAALAAEIARVRALHGVAVLYDCHSIRSVCPFLFEGRLPDFNIGTDNGRTCAPAFETAVADLCAAADGYSHVVNGRFRGGWTTRHYGKPADKVHAIQMELTQASHLASEDPPFDYDPQKAERLRAHLAKILTRIEAIASSLTPGDRP